MESKKTVYRVIEETMEVSSSSRFGDGSLVGRPFPRALSAEEIENLFFAQSVFDGKKLGDYSAAEDAVAAAKKICVDTKICRNAVPVIVCSTVRVEEIEIDDDGVEDWTGNCVEFFCDPYRAGAPETGDFTGVYDAVIEYRASDPDPDNWAVCYCDQGKLWYHVDGCIDLDEQSIDWDHPDEVELDD